MERIIIAGIENPLFPDSFQELENLVYTAGGITVGKIIQRKNSPDPAFYIGKGKVQECAEAVEKNNADIVIFDNELSAVQIRNVESLVDVRVIDRTALILDIFAGRAISREGKLQVELAQLKYMLPRLSGKGVQLSRLGGGIGTRGPGEKKLETDRRHIRRRIRFIEEQIHLISKRRTVTRAGRQKSGIKSIAVVGYTNSGKTTLINTICGSQLVAEDKLFATLDSASRSVLLPGGNKVILTDTVGFIQNLPHELIESFKSTLEEVLHADLIMHVVDISARDIKNKISVVDGMLMKIGAIGKIPVITVYNKIDIEHDRSDIKEPIYVSAITGEGISDLLDIISTKIYNRRINVTLLVPYNQGWVSPWLRKNGEIIEEMHLDEGTSIKAQVEIGSVHKIEEFILRQEI